MNDQTIQSRSFNMDWFKIQRLINEPLPECIKRILSWCAYDTFASLRHINCESITEIQRQVNLHFRSKLKELNCCHSDHYKQQSEFELLPGHRDFILALPAYLCASIASSTQNTAFSTVLNSMIETAQQNSDRDKHNAQYNDIIRCFSTYVFLLCGRSCYEVLNSNLPLPSTRTVCKCKIEFVYVTYMLMFISNHNMKFLFSAV